MTRQASDVVLSYGAGPRLTLALGRPAGPPRWHVRTKRVVDVVVALGVAVVALPVFAIVALAIKLDSWGPVLFRQPRVGRRGSSFEMLKFRTMAPGAERLRSSLAGRNEADGPLFRVRRDPRCTRVGRILRTLCLDELPQLWNVLRGDMSLVGPRPALAEEMEHWVPEVYRRLEVKPGITGMWQISGPARWSSFESYVRLDLRYVDTWSVWTDFAILARTVPRVLFGRAA